MFKIRQSQEIAKKIKPVFNEIQAQYNEKKYSPELYTLVKEQFSNLEANPNIHDALTWKYGDANKKNFPQSHRNIIIEVERAWPIFVTSQEAKSPLTTFNWWQNILNKNTRFITNAFITHLVHHREIPIIDQHNFRAMNHLLATINPTFKIKTKPSNWQDVINLKDFINPLAETLSCSHSELDRFLMMLGSGIKKKGGLIQYLDSL